MRVRAEVPDMASHVPLESGRNSFLMFEPVLYAVRIRTPFLAIRGDVDEIVPMGKSERLICKSAVLRNLASSNTGRIRYP